MADDVSGEMKDLVALRMEAVRRGDYFGVLGLDAQAGPAEIQKAYFELAKKIHPDKVASQGLQDLKTEAAAIFEFATTAKDVIADKVKRALYLKGDLKAIVPRGMAGTGARGGGSRARNADEVGKISFHKGGTMLKKRDYAEAERFFRQAVDAVDGNARYWQDLGFAIFHNTGARSDEDRLEEARRCWEAAIEIDHQDAQGHFYLALYHKAKGDMRACQKALEQALLLDKEHVGAQREMRLIKMRSGKRKETPSGIFNKLISRIAKKK